MRRRRLLATFLAYSLAACGSGASGPDGPAPGGDTGDSDPGGDALGDPDINTAPVVAIEGELEGVTSATPGDRVTLTGTASDPNDDPVSLTWSVWSMASPTTDCGADFAAVNPTPASLQLVVPVAPPTPDCDGDVLVVLTGDDGQTRAFAYRTLLVAPVLNITFPSDRRELVVGGETTVTASSMPAASKTYDWTVESADGGCSAGDLTIAMPGTDPADTNTQTRRTLSVALLPGVAGCAFLVRATATLGARSAHDDLTVNVTNAGPSITVQGAAEVSPGHLRVTVPPASTPSFTSLACDADGHDLTQTWTGDVTALTCAGSCEDGPTTPPTSCTTYTVAFAAPASAGDRFLFTVAAADGIETATVVLEVVVEACLWVDDDASGPTYDGSLSDPYAEIGAALDAARRATDTNVCVIEGTYVEDLVIPASDFDSAVHSSPDLIGGFAAGGEPGVLPPRIEASTAAGTTFAPAYGGTLSHLVLAQAPGLTLASEAAAVAVSGASPRLDGVQIIGGAGEPSIGLLIAVEGSLATAPVLSSSVVYGSNNPAATTAIGILVRPTGGAGAPQLGPANWIYAGAGNGLGTAIRFEPGVSVAVTGNEQVSACAPGAGCTLSTAVGIDIVGGGVTGGIIDGNRRVEAGGDVSQASFAIRLSETDHLTVSNNAVIGSPRVGGAVIAHGIADGSIEPDGTIVPGSSSALTISGNGTIAGGGQLLIGTCTGTHLAAGILLVGSGGATTVRDNGWGSDELRGGVVSLTSDSATERVVPSAPAIWTVGTDGVEILDNRVVAGDVVEDRSVACSPPPARPWQVAVRDGLPPRGPAGAQLGSTSLTLRRNAAICGAPSQPPSGAAVRSTCVAIELDAPIGVGLENNILATISGDESFGLWVRGGGGVEAVHNTIDPDFTVFGAPPALGTIRKVGIRVDDADENGVSLANNLVFLRRDDPYDDPDNRLALLETTAAEGSTIGVLSTNLFYLERDVLESPTVPQYVRVVDAVGTAEYAAAGVNAVAGIPVVTGNIVGVAGLGDPGFDKEALRLTIGSAAIDACDPVRSVSDDIDGDPRPNGAGCDIGADEL